MANFKDYINKATDWMVENPAWTAAGTGLTAGTLAALLSQRGNKFRNFLIGLATGGGGAYLGLKGYGSYRDWKNKQKAGMINVPGVGWVNEKEWNDQMKEANPTEEQQNTPGSFYNGEFYESPGSESARYNGDNEADEAAETEERIAALRRKVEAAKKGIRQEKLSLGGGFKGNGKKLVDGVGLVNEDDWNNQMANMMGNNN